MDFSNPNYLHHPFHAINCLTKQLIKDLSTNIMNMIEEPAWLSVLPR